MTNKTPRKNRQNHLGAKLLLTSTALAASLGLWQFFSREDVELKNSSSEKLPETDTLVSTTLFELPPLPTLVPLRTVTVSSSLRQVSDQSANSQTLRQVSVPNTPTPSASVKKPVIQSVFIDNPNPVSSDADDGGGKKSSGAAKTKSS